MLWLSEILIQNPEMESFEQLKEELGLDHFEGRSWNGLHHHIGLCFMAYDFLQTLVRSRGRGKK